MTHQFELAIHSAGGWPGIVAAGHFCPGDIIDRALQILDDADALTEKNRAKATRWIEEEISLAVRDEQLVFTGWSDGSPPDKDRLAWTTCWRGTRYIRSKASEPVEPMFAPSDPIRVRLDPIIRQIGIREVARRSAITAGGLHRWLTGASDLRLQTLYRVIRACGVAIDVEGLLPAKKSRRF